MMALDKEKSYQINEATAEGLKDFYGGFADQASTSETIEQMYRENKYLMDTHTAVGYKVYRDYAKASGDKTPTIIASTASAYKFAESVTLALGLPKEVDGFAAVQTLNKATGVKIPACLKNLEHMQVLHKTMLKKDQLEEAVRNTLK
jgi:threonine synthase